MVKRNPQTPQQTERRAMQLSSYRNFLFGLLIFLLGAAAGYFVGSAASANRRGHGEHSHSHMNGFRYTNPLLDCEIAADESHFDELKPFKYKIQQLIEQARVERRADSVSVYFRDLDNGVSFGVNSSEKFSPASLMKVPVMMGYLKKGETDPGILKKTMVYDGDEDWNAAQNIKPSKEIVAGKPYTVDELIFRMIAYSDNNAWSVLFGNIGPDYLDSILAEIHIDYDPEKREDFMTLKGYSSFFRVLYNATYLSRPMSEKALEYLAHPDFHAGIRAGVPKGIAVASKFGERVSEEAPARKQLHEVGIIYYPGHPYLLGIMTRGTDFGRQATVMKEISRLVCDEVHKHHERKKVER